MKRLWVSIMLAVFCLSRADMLQIPYANGKLAQSIVITLDNGNAVSPDSIRIGNAFVVEAYAAFNNLAVCSNRHELGLLFHVGEGTARRRTAIDTNWMGYPAYPVVSSMRNLDSLPRTGPVGGNPGQSFARATGYIFARPGDVECRASTFDFDSAFSQVIFVQAGGVSAKLKIVGFTQTLPGPPPPQYQDKILNTITLRLVANTDANDLVDPNPPVALRADRSTFRPGASRLRMEYDLYNPLGIRLRGVPGDHAPALSVPLRKR